MTSNKFYRSILFQLPAILCSAVLIPMLLLLQFNVNTLHYSAISLAKETIQNDLSSKALSMDYVISEAEKFSQDQSADRDVLSKIKTFLSAESPYQRSITRSMLTAELRQSIVNSQTINEIYLFADGSDVICSTLVGEKEIPVDSPKGKLLMKDYEKNRGLLTWSPGTVLEDGTNRLLLCRPLTIEGFPLCMLVYGMNTDYLSKIINNTAFQKSNLLVCDYRGNILLSGGIDNNYSYFNNNINKCNNLSFILAKIHQSNNRADSFDPSAETENCVIAYQLSQHTLSNWIYIEIGNTSEIIPSGIVFSKNLVLMVLIAAFSALLGVYFISSIVLRPIQKLLSVMKSARGGQFFVAEGEIPQNELGQLIIGYNDMIIRLQKLIQDVYIQELSKRDAQLKQIQSQLDDHFLYNTLNTIYCVIKQGNGAMASEMVMMLSKFFRLNLSGGNDYVRLSDVDELIWNYLAIQKIRFGDRMKVSIQMDDDLQNQYVLKYLFQPIVENAIQHGIESRLNGGTIQIAFHKEGNFLLFETSDNGVGIPQDQLNELRQAISNYTDPTEKNFSLKTINEQIRLVYGKGYKLCIESHHGVGTKVSFKIPLSGGESHGV